MLWFSVKKNILIIGNTSNFSIALQEFFFQSNFDIDFIYTEEIRIWSSDKNWSQIQHRLESKIAEKSFEFTIYATGLTNVDVDQDQLRFLNVDLPLFLNKVFTAVDLMTVYAGAVMENFPEYCNGSKYLASKLELSRNLESSGGNWINLRFNQWYGTKSLRSHLFLGAAIESLKNRTPFCMGSGLQLREFHHIQDDLPVFSILDRTFLRANVNMCHGETLRLKDLAVALFTYFDCENLLRLNCRKDPPNDNYSSIFPRNPILDRWRFRSTVAGVIEYAKEFL